MQRGGRGAFQFWQMSVFGVTGRFRGRRVQVNALLNTHFRAHGRSSFTDAEDPNERRHLRRLWLKSDAWSAHRPPVMQRIIDTSRHWEKSDTTVQMWDGA